MDVYECWFFLDMSEYMSDMVYIYIYIYKSIEVSICIWMVFFMSEYMSDMIYIYILADGRMYISVVSMIDDLYCICL